MLFHFVYFFQCRDYFSPGHTGLLNEIYDEQILYMARRFIKLTERLAAKKQQLTFSIRTRRHNLIPGSLQVQPFTEFLFITFPSMYRLHTEPEVCNILVL